MILEDKKWRGHEPEEASDEVRLEVWWGEQLGAESEFP